MEQVKHAREAQSGVVGFCLVFILFWFGWLIFLSCLFKKNALPLVLIPVYSQQMVESCHIRRVIRSIF